MDNETRDQYSLPKSLPHPLNKIRKILRVEELDDCGSHYRNLAYDAKGVFVAEFDLINTYHLMNLVGGLWAEDRENGCRIWSRLDDPVAQNT